MVSSIDPTTNRFLKSLSNITDRLNRAEQQIASGKRLLVASDEPDQIGNLLQRRAQLAQVNQIQTNLNESRTSVDTAEQGLEGAAKIMDRLQTIAAEGASGTQTADTNSGMAVEVEALMSQLVGIAQTSVDGRYIFSGDADQAVPYTLNLAYTYPLSPYGGSQSTLQAMAPSGTLFNVAKTAQEIFDNPDPTKNVFQAANSLRLALKANDRTAIEQAIGDLNTSSRHLNSEQSFYGTVQNRLASARDEASKSQVRLKTELSSIEDTDMAQAIVDMNQASLQQNAALQTYAKLPRTSLFNFLG